MKKLFFTLVLLGFYVLPSLAQNSIWSLPNSYVEFDPLPDPQPLPAPTSIPGNPNYTSGYDLYDGLPAQNTHNAMADGSNSLLFFVVDGFVYDKHGYLIADQMIEDVTDPADQIKGVAEVTIVPDPASCWRYYIFSSSYGSEANTACYTHIDFSVQNPHFQITEARGAPVIGTASTTNSTKLTEIGWPNNQSGGPGEGNHFYVNYAATGRRADNSHLLFVGSYSNISTIRIDENGVSYEDVFNMTDILDDLPFSTGTIVKRSELEVFEMSNGHYKLAVSLHAGPNNSGVIAVIEVDEDGNYVAESAVTHYIHQITETSTTPLAKGLEFSANGTYLYFTHHTTSLNPNAIEYLNTQNGTSGVLNVSNANNYQYSQIELGIDGKLYFAYQNGLSTLADSENPTSAWNASAVSFNYSLSDAGNNGVTADFLYLLPDQLDGVDYSEFPGYDHYTFTAPATDTWLPGDNPLISSNSDVVRIEHELRIPAGVHITIEGMRFEFFENARCIIEAGASLTLDETTFTVGPCDALMWHGIEVWGNPALPQTPTSNQGFLAMRNGSVVEHARTGAIMAKKTFNMFGGAGYSTSHYGGFVHASNSTFRNNEKDVVIKSYVNGNVPNRCRFTNTHFLTDGLLNHPNIFPAYHAELEKVYGVLFTNCSFLNTASFQDHSITKRGIGINASYATFRVIGNNEPFTGDLEAAHQSFYQLFMGIRTWGGESHPFMASKMDFQMNQTGILAVGVCFESIIFNKFTVPENLNNYIDFPIGCYLIGSYLFTLEENEFESEDSEWNINYGLIVANSSKTGPFFSHQHPDVVFNGEDVENEVYRNNFTDFKYAFTVLGDNRGQVGNRGLQARCNQFFNCETDFFLPYDEAFSTPAWRDDQGSSAFEYELANNVFSFASFDCNSAVRDFRVSETVPFQYGEYYSAVLDFEYKCLFDPTVSPVECGNVHLEIENFFTGQTFNEATHCPSNFGTPGPVGPMQLQLVEARSNLETAIELYNITVDGGEKEDILDALAAAHSYESQFLRNMLLERYPLSHEVLMAALARASSFDPWHLTQVLVANAKLSNDIMNFLEDNEVLSPFFMQFIYDANASGSNSLRAILKSEISYRSYDKSRIERKINRHYLDADSLDATGWNDFMSGQTADYYLMYRIENSLQTGNVNKAIELKDSLTATHPDRLDWIDFKISLANADSVSAAHINTAWDFYYDSPAVLADAMAWLTTQGLLDTMPLPPVHAGEPRSLSSSKPRKASNQRNFLEAWPNPATDRVMLTYPNEADGMGIIQIFNQQGVMVHQVAAQGKGIAEINTTQWPAGIYIALLKVEGKVFDEVKISVVR